MTRALIVNGRDPTRIRFVCFLFLTSSRKKLNARTRAVIRLHNCVVLCFRRALDEVRTFTRRVCTLYTGCVGGIDEIRKKQFPGHASVGKSTLRRLILKDALYTRAIVCT